MRRAALVLLALAACSAPGRVGSPPVSPSGSSSAPVRVSGPPVWVVPGYGSDADSVAALVAALRAAGRAVEVGAVMGDPAASMTEDAAALDALIRGSRAARVDVVGFSAGGIVVRRWLSFAGNAKRARHVVTLSAPNHGSTALRHGECGGGCVDLLPGSDLLALLDADETPAGPDYVAFWTADDEAVTPPASATLAGARNVKVQDACPGRRVAHLEMVTDPAVIGLAVRALADGPRARLSC
jgi:triacylglycerol esterase/lipase EstA (alpha/beta hydrolase family)